MDNYENAFLNGVVWLKPPLRKNSRFIPRGWIVQGLIKKKDEVVTFTWNIFNTTSINF